jgi:hypothetical protein
LRARRAAPGLAPGFTRRLARTGWVALGVAVVIAGALIGALPGPGGIPVVSLGLVMILKNSRGARRAFVRAQRRWPRALTPVRRLLRDPRGIGPLLLAPLRAIGRRLAAAPTWLVSHRTVAPAP